MKYIIFFILILLNKFTYADSNRLFKNYDNLNNCIVKFENFKQYKTSLGNCLSSKNVNFSKKDLDYLSDTKIKKKKFKNFDDLPKLIKTSPQFIYGADTYIRSLSQAKISNLDKQELIVKTYNNFDTKLLASSSKTNEANPDLKNAIFAFAGLFVIDNMNKEGSKTVNLSTNRSTITENSGSSVTVTASLSGVVSTPTTINLTVSGTATAGTDYSTIASSITIPTGLTSASTTFTMIDDNISDVDETIIISISSVTGQNVSIGTSSATVTITDDETVPSISLAASATSIAENSGSNITLTATSSIISSSNIVVSLASSGTATSGSDYGAISSITIPAGSTTATTTFTPTDDNFYDGGNETAIFDISSISGGSATENGTQQVTVTITENESAPTVTLTSSTNSIAENGAGTVTLTATLSGRTYENTVVVLSFTGTTSSTDYLGLTSIIIPSGDLTGTENLGIVNDTIFETNETIIIDVSSVSGGGATESGTQQQTITITNDDSAPTLTLSSSSSVDEDGSAITITGTLSNPTYQTVTVGISASGTATLNTDYTLSSTSFTIAAEATTGSVTAIPTNDNTFEGDETIIIDVSSVSGGSATESGTQQVTIALKEDDAGPELSVNDVTTSDESASNATFTITTSTTSASNMTVDYATSNGTATAGSDYTSTNGTATITAGQSSTTFTVGVLHDILDEPNETVNITLSNPTLATISDSTGILTITDDDTAPSISIANVTAAENAGTATMTASIAAASGKDITFDYATSNGTATAGSDYTAGSGSLTIAAGQNSITFTVAITNDSTDENNETVTVAISNATNTSNSSASATLTITDDDNAPSLSIADAQSTDESASSTNLTVSLSAASEKAISVDYATSNGTATAGSDYTATNGTLNFAAGETSKIVAVTVIQDSTFEGNETVTITISNASNATISDATATFTITEDDAGPSLSINDRTVDEDAGSATFTVTLSPTSASAITVDYATSNGTATAGSDYTSASGTLTFNAGDSSKTISITVANDSLDEANETATITLSNASGASTSDNTGFLTITDDDASPTISINSSASVTEGDSGTSTQSMTVTQSAASGRDVTFNYAITAGTASSADFTADSGSLTISAGDTTKTIPVTIKGDTTQESRTVETVIVTISNVTNASVSGTGIGTISITDNDGLNDDADNTLTYNSSTATLVKSDNEFNVLGNGTGANQGSDASTQNPFEIANFHKAAAYGLTGSGKQIAIVDSGYDFNHVELDTVTGTVYGSITAATGISVSQDHGNFVSGIMVAEDNGIGVQGVAPNSSLHVSDYSQKGAETYYADHWANLTNNASSAVVQNNSWGYSNEKLSTVQAYMSSNSVDATTATAAYYSAAGATSNNASVTAQVTALNNFQNHGVIVWANSNSSLDDADLHSGLPVLFPELEEAWITANNINVKGNAGSETYEIKGAQCGQAAAFCMGADGWGIKGLGDANILWLDGGGTSFSAPQISGAVALLAEAFPNQTPANWRDRLLASANNALGFSQTGSVTFGNGVVHGYSAEAGHGLLDIYAALQPIYSDSAARSVYAGASDLSGQRFDLVQSGLQTSRSFGDGLSNGLTGLSNYFYDGLNGGFKYDMSGHVSQIAEMANTINLKNELESLDKPKNAPTDFNRVNNFTGSAFDSEAELKKGRFIATANGPAPAVQSFFNSGPNSLSLYSKHDIPYLATDEGGVGITYAENFGETRLLFSLNRPVELDAGKITKGKQKVAVMSLDTMITPAINIGFVTGNSNETDNFLGLKGTEAFNLDDSETNTSFIGVKSRYMIGNDLKVSAIATSGQSNMYRKSDGIIRGANEVVSNSYKLSLEKFNLLNKDNLAISLTQPNRVENGSVSVITNNLSDTDGNLTYNYHNISIVPSGRQKDLAISYSSSVNDNLVISTKFVTTQELNHVKDSKEVYSGFIGFKSGNFKMGTSAGTHRKGFDAQLQYSLDF